MYPRVANAAYRQANAAVAPTVALVRVYDELIVAMTQAVRAMEEGKHETCFARIQRVTTILRGLDCALDFDRGGDIAERLHKVYNSYILQLHISYTRPDRIARYRRLMDGLRSLREAWVQVALEMRGG